MKQNKYDNALLRMVGTCRVWCTEPRPDDEYIYATDSYIMLRVCKSLCAATYMKHEKQPKDFEKCLTKVNTALLLNIYKVAEVIKQLEPTEVTFKCGDCGGDGQVCWTYEDHDGDEHTKLDECPVCRGTGKVTTLAEVTEQNIEINGDCFNVGKLMHLLEVIHSLEIDTVTVEHIGDYRAMRIKVNEDIDAMIMPNKNCRPTAKITLKPIEK